MIGYDHRALGYGVVDADEPRDANDVLGVIGVDGDQGLMVVVVDVGQIGELPIAERSQRCLEAHVPALVREPLKPSAQEIAVIRPEWADDHA